MSTNMIGVFQVGVTMVGADPNVVLVDAGGGTAHGESRVGGSMSLAYSLIGNTVGASTVIATSTLGLAGRVHVSPITGGTVVTNSAGLMSSNLYGRVLTRTTVGSATMHMVNLALRAAPHGVTTILANLRLDLLLSSTAIVGSTTLTGNLTFPRLLSGGLSAGQTSVAATATIHILHGNVIHGKTAVTSLLNMKGAFSGHPAGRTAVATREGGFRRSLPLSGGTCTGATTLIARMHAYPEDFLDVHILTRTSVSGNANLSSQLKAANISPIRTVTAVVAVLTAKLRLAAAIHGETSVADSRVRVGFGADLQLRTTLRSALGIQTGIHSWLGRTIIGRTAVVANAPSNGFRGLAACGTIPHASITLAWAIQAFATGSTQFHSHFGGRFAHDGPFGSVTLTSVPRGDLGIPDEISGSTRPSADITVERHRMMVILGNSGLSVDRSLVAHGTAASGTGIRQVGVPVNVTEKVRRQVAYYV